MTVHLHVGRRWLRISARVRLCAVCSGRVICSGWTLEKGSLGKLPGSGCTRGWSAHAQFGLCLFFHRVFIFRGGERVGRGGGVCGSRRQRRLADEGFVTAAMEIHKINRTPCTQIGTSPPSLHALRRSTLPSLVHRHLNICKRWMPMSPVGTVRFFFFLSSGLFFSRRFNTEAHSLRPAPDSTGPTGPIKPEVGGYI